MRVKLGLKHLWIVGTIFLLIAFYQGWNDEHKNAKDAMYGKDGKAEAWSKFNGCDKERAVKSALADTYSGTIANQQMLLNGQQATFNTMQGTFNACVTGNINKLKAATQKTLILAAGVRVDPKLGSHWLNMIVMTNQITLVDFRLHCDVEIGNVTAGIINTSVMLSGRGGGRVSPHDWDISIGAPAMSPINPLEIVMYYNGETSGTCTVRSN